MTNRILTACLPFCVILVVYWLGWGDIYWPSRIQSIRISDFLNIYVIFNIIYFALAHVTIIALVIFMSVLTANQLAPKHRLHLRPLLSAAICMLIVYIMIGYSLENYPNISIALISSNTKYLNHYNLLAIPLIVVSFISMKKLISNRQKKTALLYGSFTTVLLSPLVGIQYALPSPSHNNQSKNIIFIGIDSVSKNQLLTNINSLPHIKKLLNRGGTFFDNAYTPIARTFPAWNSILTGQYPSVSNIRFNLAKFTKNSMTNNLVTDLKILGYTTIYAQDERRFNNIDERYGFDEVIGPPIGFSDFIIPNLSDNLFSTYFLDSIIGKILFRSLYINRVSSITYSPIEFVNNILKATNNIDEKLFLAVHFCLAHYPYTWNKEESPALDEIELHRNALIKIDQQIGQLLNGLASKGLYQNSLIILLSDHGEGLGSKPATWTKINTPEIEKFQRILRGHGNSLMSVDQNNIILFVSSPDDVSNIKSKSLVSLIDIRPTILDFLSIEPPKTMNGQSLYDSEHSIHRPIFMETGIQIGLPNPRANSEEIALYAKDKFSYYGLDHLGRLVLKSEYAQEQTGSKQFGLILDDVLLIKDVLVQGDDNFIFVSLKNGMSSQNMRDDVINHRKKATMLSILSCYSNKNTNDCDVTSNTESITDLKD